MTSILLLFSKQFWSPNFGKQAGNKFGRPWTRGRWVLNWWKIIRLVALEVQNSWSIDTNYGKKSFHCAYSQLILVDCLTSFLIWSECCICFYLCLFLLSSFNKLFPLSQSQLRQKCLKGNLTVGTLGESSEKFDYYVTYTAARVEYLPIE